MSSEKLASAKDQLKGDLGGSWNILEGSESNYTDLGIARRFGGSSAAYSLRDIGAMNGSVVRVRREPYDTSTTEIQDEEDFSANQVSSGVLEDWVNGKLEDTLPADVNYVVGLESARYFNGTNSGVVTSSISGLVNATGSIETSFALFAKNEVIVSFEDNSDVDDNLTIQTDSSGFLTILHRTNGTINILGKLQTLVLDDGTLHTVRWNMSSSGSQVILDGKDITSAITFTVGNASTVKWVSDLNAPDVFSIGYRAESSPDGFATGVVVNTTIFGTDNTTPLANYLGYGSSNYWNDTIGSLNATESNITQTWEQAQGAAAAYSLRKVKADYSGNAVRIRRTSDSVEVNVAFDSDDKVSSSSAITNTTEQGGESGETNATTVADFLSEERTTFVTNPVFSVSGGGGSITQEVTNTSASFSFQGGTNNFIRDARKPANLGAETGDTISFDVTASGVSTDFSVRLRVVGANTEIISPQITDLNNGTRTITLTVGSNSPAGYFAFTDLNTTSTGTITIDNIKVVGKSATVHTWYDQAGSNDATQATAANQPKIAENGALLADGIDFDGSNDFLGFGADICDNINNFSAFTIAKSDGGNGGLQVLFSVGFSGDGTIFAQARDDSNIEAHFGNGSSSANVVNLSQNVSQFESDMLFTTIGGSSTSKGFADAVEGGSVSSASANPTNATGGIGMHVGSSNPFDGSVKEAIFYNSDQSANRFKIESNINNYYDLYNDANDLAGNFTVDSSGSGTDASISNESKTGFTATVVDKAGFFGADLNEAVPNGSNLYISFTANLSPSGGTAATPNFGLANSADKTGNSTGNPLDTAVTEGFNSITVAGTSSTCDRIRFTEGNDNVSFVISDLKVSRIARNGFVETLYDQSGNGRDISQASASNQPTIVSNGGIYKSGAYPSIRYTDTSATYLVTESYSPVEKDGSGMPNFTLFAVTGIPEAAGFDSIVSAGGSEGSNSIGGFKLRHLKDTSGNIDSRIDIAQAGVSPHQANAQSNNATPQSVNLHTSYLDSTDDELFAQQNSATSGTSTTTLIPLSGQGAENDNLKVGTDMFNNTPRANYLGEILEVILYTESKKSELSQLTNEINNFYNI